MMEVEVEVDRTALSGGEGAVGSGPMSEMSLGFVVWGRKGVR